MRYCESVVQYKRLRSKAVQIGKLRIGDLQAIRIQSMTTTDTENVQATADQVMALADAGCEIVRITAPNISAANALEKIVAIVRQRAYDVPLVADIHFTPNAAIRAAEFVEKVRINPGNYVDKKKFESYAYNDIEYADELKRIEDKFIPLIDVLKKHKRALRIGTNHGSLSDRIMNRYGDSPEGMVASAWEFAEICRRENFHNFVFSMKASNPQVMIQAYRLLSAKMIAEDAIYPLHLGVTEAGDGEDGRIKSYIGIGSLLEDGLGDTLRVSLTESPLKEIPVAKRIVDHYHRRTHQQTDFEFKETRRSFYSFQPRLAHAFTELDIFPLIIRTAKRASELNDSELSDLRYIDFKTGNTADFYLFQANSADDLSKIEYFSKHFNVSNEKIFIESNSMELLQISHYSKILHVNDIRTELDEPDIHLNLEIVSINLQNFYTMLGRIKNLKALTLSGEAGIAHYRMAAELLKGIPLLLQKETGEDLELEQSILFGALLCDGIGNGIIATVNGDCAVKLPRLFNILQATRVRISKTEYISCPSCGRTLFDLEDTTAKIKEKTAHLKGVKIAVMGCIVNGPGEMADADFGYVGSGVDRINLYVGKELVKRNIATEFAVDELIQLIRDHGKWKEANHEFL